MLYTPTVPKSVQVPGAQTERWDADLVALHYMQSRLLDFLSRAEPPQGGDRWATLYLPEPRQRCHRVVLLDSTGFQPGEQRTFVGFFGQKRPEVDGRVLDALDEELIAELYDYPALLSYSSLERADGSWGNLVLLRGPEGIAQWANSVRHAYAAQEVAPRCYTSIRLHIGTLTLGAPAHEALRVSRTKVFEF
ncbi:MAG TPA: hypothetical protein VFS21_30755 [Roseiflexaceae bacterium]|nr:hypothetical protein [Roseiflexaceae bacterium]